MRVTSLLGVGLATAAVMAIVSCATSPTAKPQGSSAASPARLTNPQVPSWSEDDMQFFLHGSMSTEFAPEPVLRAFIRTYPDLFPNPDLSNLGLIPDPQSGWPVGFSRASVAHLGGLSSVGVNCASCHLAEVTPTTGEPTVRVLGATSHFDAEAFFAAVITATFRTSDPKNMRAFLVAYLNEFDPLSDEGRRHTRRAAFDAIWQRQEAAIVAAIAEDPTGSKNPGPGGLHQIAPISLRLDGPALVTGIDLASTSRTMLRLFHNMRAALHVPDEPPKEAPPTSGPGRNDAFGLLSAILLQSPQPFAPVKLGLVWNLSQRRWVNWDGNTQSPIGRNLLASLGLGAPLIGHEGKLDFALVERQTTLTERILAPRYPWKIDSPAARRGATHYHSLCASCHDGPEGDNRSFAIDEIGTDPTRGRLFSPEQAERFNGFLASLVTPGYVAPKEPGLRSTQKYWASSMHGVWARSPYLHNGSVRTMKELLTEPAARPTSFRRGSRAFDTTEMGYTDGGSYLFDARAGNGNGGHDYGTKLSPDEKRDLIEFLKTL